MWEKDFDKKIVGYARVSTEEQKKKGFGIDIQVRAIDKFGEENNIKVAYIFKDEAVSGNKEKREDLNKLLNLCKLGKIKGVIFPSTDRTARNVRFSENLYYELTRYNVRLYFTDMPYYDHENYNDIMFRQLKEVFAEGNRNAIIDRLKKGRQERIRKGKPPGGTVPYGYKRKNKKWYLDHYESGVVKLIFELAKSKAKPFKIAKILNEQGLKRRNGWQWVGQEIKEILSRKELYQNGTIHYGGVVGQNKKLIILGDD